MASAGLPTTVISEEALQKGREWQPGTPIPRKPKKVSKKASKPREPKVVTDPLKGLAIPEATANALIAAGGKDNRNKTPEAAVHNPVDGSNEVSAIAAPNGQPDGIAPLIPTPTGPTNFVFSRTVSDLYP